MPRWGQDDEDLLRAYEMAVAIRSGQQLNAIPTTWPTPPGETVHSEVQCTLQQFIGANVSYNRGGFLALGNPLFTAATLGASLLYNASQRRNAERQAAVQWRAANHGLAYFSNRRLALQGQTGWFEIPWSELRNAAIDPAGIIVWPSSGPPLRLVLPWLACHYVLLRYLAFNDSTPVEIPDDLARRAAAAGRPLPSPMPVLPASSQWAPPDPTQGRPH